MSSNSKPFAFRLEPELLAKLSEIADATPERLSRNQLVAYILEQYVDVEYKKIKRRKQK